MTVSIITPWSGSTAHLVADYTNAARGCDDIALVDNASDEPTAKELAFIKDYRSTWKGQTTSLIQPGRNLGFSLGNNRGYQQAHGDIIIFLNSDVAGSPAWLDAVRTDIRPGALYGPAILRQMVYGISLPYIEGWCVAATRDTWERLCVGEGSQRGPWDAEAYPEPYWEDVDLSLRALNAGIDLVPTTWGQWLTHKGGQTIGPVAKRGDVYERNRATFAERVRRVWERQMAEAAK